MHLLIRRISSYTAADVLLGVFETAEQAQSARAAYAARYAADPDSDPWREQGYKDAGLPIGDLVIRELAAPSGSAEVLVVSNYSEGFGQVVRKFDSLHRSKADADRRMAELDAQDDLFPHYAICQRAVVGVLLSDAREDQPCLT